MSRQFQKGEIVVPRGCHKLILGDVTGKVIDSEIGMAIVFWQGYGEPAIMRNHEIKLEGNDG